MEITENELKTKIDNGEKMITIDGTYNNVNCNEEQLNMGFW